MMTAWLNIALLLAAAGDKPATDIIPVGRRPTLPLGDSDNMDGCLVGAIKDLPGLLAEVIRINFNVGCLATVGDCIFT